MKLIYIINARIPTEKAHGFQICKMCEMFSRNGADVELFVPTISNQIEEDVFTYYKIKENFKYKKIKTFDFISLSKYIGKFGFLLQHWFFLIVLAFKKIDKKSIIYTRDQEIAWLFAQRGYRTVYECHNWYGRKRFFLKNINYIVTTNNYIKKKLIDSGIKKNKFLIAPNGVDLDIFDINISREEAILKLGFSKNIKDKIENKKILVYTGSFSTKGISKGVDVILKAASLIKDNNIAYFFVGGNEKDMIIYKKKAKDLGVENKVYFFDRQTQERLAFFQKIADVLLMPFIKIGDYEYPMTPLKMFEYMASKRPIIASNLPTIREILKKDNSVLFAPGDSKDLVRKINKILLDKDLAVGLSDHALRDVQKYTWENRAKKILEFVK